MIVNRRLRKGCGQHARTGGRPTQTVKKLHRGSEHEDKPSRKPSDRSMPAEMMRRSGERQKEGAVAKH